MSGPLIASKKKFRESIESAVSEFISSRHDGYARERLYREVRRILDNYRPRPPRQKKRKPVLETFDWNELDAAVVSATRKKRKLPHFDLIARKENADLCSVRFGGKLMGMWKRGVRLLEDIDNGNFLWFSKPSALGEIWGMEHDVVVDAVHKDAMEVLEFTRKSMGSAMADPQPELLRWLDMYDLVVTSKGLARKHLTFRLR